MAPMDFTRTHVHAIGRGESVLPRLLAEEGHLLVDEVTRVTRRRVSTAARTRARHAGAAERLVVRADGHQRDDALRLRWLRRTDDRLEVDPRDLVREVLLAQV